MILEAIKVSYRYPGSNSPAIKDVTLSLKPGTVSAFIGPNAAGKTTLLKVLALLLKPSAGRIIVDGRDPWAMNSVGKLRGRVVYVHEKPILVRGSTLYNVALGLIAQGRPGDISLKKAEETLRTLGLGRLANKAIKELSAGERQLVSLARAVAVDPRVLLLDEPGTSLDLDHRSVLLNLLEELKKRGKTIVIATHDVGMILSADLAFLLERGFVVMCGDPGTILEKWQLRRASNAL